MTTLFHDTETFCETPIRDGTHRYAEDVEIIVHSWAIGLDGPAQVWDVTAGGAMPSELEDHLLDERVTVVGQNYGMFDRAMLRHALGIEIAPERIHDIMVQALSHGLPGSLDKLSTIFRLPVDQAKDKAGKALIQLFCKPRPKNSTLRRATRHTHPVEWQRFLGYARQDIPPMRALYAKLPKWNYPAQGNRVREHDLWCLDQRINDRGFKVDLDLAHAAIATVDKAKKGKDSDTWGITLGEVSSATKRDQLLKHLLAEYGVELPDMQKATLETRLGDENLPWPVRELIANRLQVSTTSNSKYASLLKGVSADGRLRGTLQFCGAARTGRWGGRLFQPQNLPRPNMKPDDIEMGIAAMKTGSADLLYDEPIKLASNAIRGVIVAEEGRKLVVSDLSNIEGRMLAWLADERWKLKAFRDFDNGIGHDLYLITAGSILRKRPEDVTRDERQSTGKVPELACLAPDTRVLTDTGIKPIIEVLISDRLWDGETWVTHRGLVSRGSRNTIRVDGVGLTTDHEMLTENGWQSAAMVASSASTLTSCLARGSANLPSSMISAAQKEDYAASSSVAIAVPRRIGSKLTICVEGPPRAAADALRSQARRRIRSGVSMRTLFPTRGIAADCAVVCRQRSLDATALPTKLMLTTAVEALLSTNPGAKIAAYFSSILSRSMDGTTRCWRWIESTWTKVTSRAICASPQSSETPSTSDQSRLCSGSSISFGPVYDIAHAGPRNRFTILSDSGALVVHNCGYQGAAGAFGTMAALYGLDLPESRVYEIVRLWRETNPAIVQFWYEMQDAAWGAHMSPGQVKTVGSHIAFEQWRNWLKMELPSGRVITYASPAIIEDPRRKGSQTLSYMGLNSYTKRWERLTTYGGKLAENATQAAARDVLAANMQRVEAAGFPIILTVHDEVITEPEDNDNYSVDKLSALLATNPAWADGLPLAAGGFEGYRYRKD